MRGVLLATVAALTAPVAAQAAVVVTYSGYGAANGGFAGPAGGVLFDFEGAGSGSGASYTPPAGYTFTKTANVGFFTGDALPNGAAPATSATTDDTTRYLAVYGNGDSAKIYGTTAYNTATFYWGSVDTYNGFYLLDATGARISGRLTNADIIPASPGNGNQTAVNTNGRVSILSDTSFYGIEFNNAGSPAFEIDNLKFLNSAVPEAATWGMMVMGFGLIGGLARRSNKPRVAFI